MGEERVHIPILLKANCGKDEVVKHVLEQIKDIGDRLQKGYP